MAINIDDELTDPRRNYLNMLVNNAAPFFEAESNRSWDLSSNNKAVYEALDTLQLKELMRELGVNLQQLSDSVDWEKFEKDMEKWGANMEEWGNKMENWGEQFESKYNQYNQKSMGDEDPQIHAIKVQGSGDVRISQVQDRFSLGRSDKNTSNYNIVNGTLVLIGSSNYEVALQQLDEIIMSSSGDVFGRGIISGKNLHITVMGSGDLWMTADYDTIYVRMSGSGDVTLHGQCNVLYAEMSGSGDLKARQLNCAETHINSTGSGEALMDDSQKVLSYSYPHERKQTHKTLLLDANWNGFEAGLNMFFKTPPDVVNSNNGAQGMEIRPLRSWYFGFNIADVGIAFNRKHTAGIFTGVGIGWNNFSWNNDVKIEFDNDNVVYTLVPIEEDKIVKNSKFGTLFLQVPLMFEVRPVRHMYIDAGVTGGLRIAQWNRVKFADGTQVKRYYGASINQFKLDASFRIGSDYIGFFANYALLPLFDTGNAKVHPINFGFSITF